MTTSPYDTYTSPLATRNASPEMLKLWSARHKFNTWRKIWLAVAEAQHELTSNGAPDGSRGSGGTLVTKEQVEELRAVVNRPGGITDDEMKAAEKYERELRHDVMAHVHALGDSCPKAKGIIHLGMTSQDVVCNADLLVLFDSISLTHKKVNRLLFDFAELAMQFRRVPTLGFTHYQPAQPVTVGRRFANWASDIHHCRLAVSELLSRLLFRRRGLKGATGTQASYLALMGDDGHAVDRLEAGFLYFLDEVGWEMSPINRSDALASVQNSIEHLARMIEMMKSRQAFSGEPPASIQDNVEAANQAEIRRLQSTLSDLKAKTDDERVHWKAMQFMRDRGLGVLGQTYPRVIDTFILADLASVASVLHKIATDIRLLCNRKEIDEPFEDKQIGSSAMPYKRNPMRCERICGLTRFVMNLVGNAYDTAATQWLERTLDDSSNRRLSLPEAFLALDGALDLMHNVASGLIVHEAMVKKNLMVELPFMATENILMACVKLGGDRQAYHEHIRRHAQAAGLRVKQEGLDNDLLDRLKADKAFHPPALKSELDWDGLLDPMKYVGRSVEQTERFFRDVVEPLRETYWDDLEKMGNSGPRV